MVKRNILLSVCFFMFLDVQANCMINYEIETMDTIRFGDGLITYIGSPPVFEGDLDVFINKEIVYPRQALVDSLEGVVYVSFLIDTLGQTFSHSISRGITPELDKEALRVSRLIHFKKPAMQKNKPIVVPLVVPVRFRLSDVQYLLNRMSDQLDIIIQDSVVKADRNCMTISFAITRDSLHITKITYTIFLKSKRDYYFVDKILKECKTLNFPNGKGFSNDTYIDKYSCKLFKEKKIEFLDPLKEQRIISWDFFEMSNVERLKSIDYLYHKYNKIQI